MVLMQGHYKNGFNQNNEEYKGEYDDYEDGGIEDDADDEKKVEEPKPNKEVLQFLKDREKLKEKYRQKLRKESGQYGRSSQSQDKKKTSTKASFGSIFGPSQPIIAPRVLDIWRSIRESRHVTSKPPGSSSGREGCSSVASSEGKIYEHHHGPQVNEVKMKVKALKDMRDYSFLFADDTDLPDKEPPPPVSHHASAPIPLTRSAQTSLESKIPVGRPLKSVSNGREPKSAVLASRDMQTKVSTKEVQVSRHIPSLSEPRKPLPKAMPSKVPLKLNVVGQVMGTKKLNGKPEIVPSTSKSYIPTQNHYVEQKRASQATDRSKPALKQAPTMKSQPPKRIPSHDINDERFKKMPLKRRQDEGDGDNAIQIIRNMFRYNPSKYSGIDDDDDSDMEAGFSQIQQEELMSAQIARKEDEEQLRLIEEEERRERMRKKQKMN